jgi:hypothetical protein
LSDDPPRGILTAVILLTNSAQEAARVADQTFLAQLEQRTLQLKITLGNLEAEKIRIENAIAQLQPLIPQYDGLIEAERTIAASNLAIDPPSLAPAADATETVPKEYSWQTPA